MRRIIGFGVAGHLRQVADLFNEATIAPRKQRKKINPESIHVSGNQHWDSRVEASLASEDFEKRLDEWAKLPPEELEKLYQKFSAQDEATSQVLEDDSLYQMDVALNPRSKGPLRVFWKSVSVVDTSSKGHPGWYEIALDGRSVKAFESAKQLRVPGEALAHAIAKEWSEQTQYINKLTMPLTDLASGAQQITPQTSGSRVDYLLSFFSNDNLFFRSAAIMHEQDQQIEPITEWFRRAFDIECPRIVGIGHPQFTPKQVNGVRDALLSMKLNRYQLVAMCVACQLTSSLILPLAVFNRIITLSRALEINRSEEYHNIINHGEIRGFHDIREADLVVKIAASVVAWRLTQHASAIDCFAAFE